MVVNGLRGWLVERYPLKGVDVETWVPGGAVGEQAAAVARALHHREATPARAGAGDGLRGARRVRMREFPPLGTTRMLGSGNAKRRGRYGLAWRGGHGRCQPPGITAYGQQRRVYAGAHQ